MKTKYLIASFMFLLAFSLIFNFVQAASMTISQSGADSGTVMKGKPFTVTVSGLSGSGTVTLVLPSGFSTSESLTKSFSEGTTSVSWTTVVANQKVSGAQISATISTPDTATSDSFDVILPPSISVSISPSSVSVNAGSTYTVSINIQNNGETTARFGSITVSGTGMTKSSGCSPSDIPGGGNSAITCTVTASTAGNYDVDFTISPSNADAVTESISVSVSGAGTTTTTPPTAGAPGGITQLKKTKTWTKMTPGVAEIMHIDDPEIGLKLINITVKNPAQSVTITVTKLTDKPASVVHEIRGKVYKYIEITSKNLPDENISEVKIQFPVNKTWISENRIDRRTIALNRYKNGWEKLPTQEISEDNNYIYYEAESPGFSIFAITGEEIVPTTTTLIPTTTLPTLPTTTVPTVPQVKEKPSWILAIGILMLVVIMLILWMYKKRPAESKGNVGKLYLQPKNL
jgi:PGF-pre-PGF domain-containing protein